jgi:hypothetical protein
VLCHSSIDSFTLAVVIAGHDIVLPGFRSRITPANKHLSDTNIMANKEPGPEDHIQKMLPYLRLEKGEVESDENKKQRKTAANATVFLCL